MLLFRRDICRHAIMPLSPMFYYAFTPTPCAMRDAEHHFLHYFATLRHCRHYDDASHYSDYADYFHYAAMPRH